MDLGVGAGMDGHDWDYSDGPRVTSASFTPSFPLFSIGAAGLAFDIRCRLGTSETSFLHSFYDASEQLYDT